MQIQLARSRERTVVGSPGMKRHRRNHESANHQLVRRRLRHTACPRGSSLDSPVSPGEILRSPRALCLKLTYDGSRRSRWVDNCADGNHSSTAWSPTSRARQHVRARRRRPGAWARSISELAILGRWCSASLVCRSTPSNPEFPRKGAQSPTTQAWNPSPTSLKQQNLAVPP